MLAFTKVACLIEVILYENMAKIYAFMTAKRIIDSYPVRSIYITIANFVKVEENVFRHRKGGKVANAPQEISHLKYECYSYSHGAKTNTRHHSFNRTQYKLSMDHLEQTIKQETVEETCGETVGKDRCKDVRLLS